MYTGTYTRLTQERHTRWIDGTQLLFVLLVVVGNQLIALLQYLQFSWGESLQRANVTFNDTNYKIYHRRVKMERILYSLTNLLQVHSRMLHRPPYAYTQCIIGATSPIPSPTHHINVISGLSLGTRIEHCAWSAHTVSPGAIQLQCCDSSLGENKIVYTVVSEC